MSHSKKLVLSGCALVLTSLMWSTQIHVVPFTRKAITTYLKMKSEGIISIMAGFIIRDKNLCNIGNKTSKYIIYTHISLWIQCAADVANSFIPNNLLLVIMHVVPLICLMFAWLAILICVASPNKHAHYSKSVFPL